MATLGPDEVALLRHLAGFDLVDADTLRRLDHAGDFVNDRARRSGVLGRGPSVLLRRDDQGQWFLRTTTRGDLKILFRRAR